MITMQFRIWPNKKDLFSYEDLIPMKDIIISQLRIKLGFMVLAKSIKIEQNPSELSFSVVIKGIAAGNDANTGAIGRGVMTMLSALGLRNFFQTAFLTVTEPNDMIPSEDFLLGQTAINNTLLEKYKIPTSEVPQAFLCSIELIIMDDPVYIKGGNDRYNRRSLNKWYTSQTTLFDPIRKVYIEEIDIISDGDLKARISIYMGASIEKALRDKLAAKTAPKPAASEKTVAQQEMLNDQKSLRFAAANDKVEDLGALIKKGVDVNAQDSNESKRKTALHLAVERERIDCVRALLAAGARFDIPDKEHKKTAKELALASNNKELQNLFTVKDSLVPSQPPQVENKNETAPGL